MLISIIIGRFETSFARGLNLRFGSSIFVIDVFPCSDFSSKSEKLLASRKMAFNSIFELGYSMPFIIYVLLCETLSWMISMIIMVKDRKEGRGSITRSIALLVEKALHPIGIEPSTSGS